MVYILQRMKKLYGVYIRRIAGLLAGGILFMGITQILNGMFVGYSVYSDFWHPVIWQQFYQNERKIDNIFLGSSHVFCGIDPNRLDQLTGKNNFNLSTGGQLLRGSYYLLREADKKNQLSHVYLEMYYFLDHNDQKFIEYERDWRNTDYMQWSFNKAAYMLSIGGVDQYINTLFPYTRYRRSLGDWGYITNVLKKKREIDYHDYPWEMEWEFGNGKRLICEKGFCDSTSTFEDRYVGQRVDLKEASMGEQSETYCRKIIEYCRKREIPLTLFVTPINDLELISTRDYDAYVKELRDLAAEYDLTVYDFNLAKEEYLPIQSGNYYMDANHLNTSGANLFTPFFYQVVSGEEADNEKYFYDSYEEKLQSFAPAIYGAYYIDHYDDSGKQTREVCVASNRASDMEYRIMLTPDEGEQYLVQDFKGNKEFILSAEEHGVCTIAARMKALPDEVMQTMEIRY